MCVINKRNKFIVNYLRKLKTVRYIFCNDTIKENWIRNYLYVNFQLNRNNTNKLKENAMNNLQKCSLYINSVL